MRADLINTENVHTAHKQDVMILAQHGITNPLEDYQPKAAVTRGQLATF